MYQKGQALLITILVLTIATTIALSLIGRGTVDQNISGQLEESSRAFNAAEAGIEESLQSGTGSGGSRVLTGGVNYNVTVSNIGGTTGTYSVPHKTPIGITDTIWLANHHADGSIDESVYYTGNTINLCWSMETAGARPALVVAILYENGSGIFVKRKAIDPDPTSRSNANQFDSSGISSPGGCGLTNYYQKTIDFSVLGINPADSKLAMRIRPEYSDTNIAVVTQAGINLPKQGNRLDSTGSTDSGISRKVIVYQLYRAPASIFDYVLYDQSGAILGH